MTKPRNYTTEAIIIKKVKLGEADRILTLYTPQLGKIQAVAKGVRRPRSKLSGHLELLTYSTVSLARGKNLDTVTGSQTINSFLPLKSNLELSAYAMYVTELINQFTAEHVADTPLFQLLVETMEKLCEASDSKLIMRYFEVQLLNQAGYRPQIQHCVSCHKSLQPVANCFSSAAGGVICPGCSKKQPMSRNISVNAIKVLRFLQNNNLDTVLRLKIDSALAQELESLMRGYIRYLLERDVKTTAWLDTLEEQSKKPVSDSRVAHLTKS